MTTYFTDEHEWITVNGDIGTVGITDYAQEALGDIVFVELPAAGASHTKGDEAAVVESVKAASEIYAPVDGEVTESNPALEEDPALVNSAAESDGWFYKVKMSNLSQLDGLMDAEGYKAFTDGLN
ncbi:glycine cleavage system protein GcvH [Emcibacter sp.]|uniref:glycine cleavage system protein GcvH n=1 Tax=Emcibacter sp. TaxID=1979954 RepID=UPI002AA8CB29|nr:glycine cleavage system protein GcvH [Emcibacter sp.]